MKETDVQIFLNVEWNTQKTLILTSKGTVISFLLQTVLRTIQNVFAVLECDFTAVGSCLAQTNTTAEVLNILFVLDAFCVFALLGLGSYKLKLKYYDFRMLDQGNIMGAGLGFLNLYH